MGEKAQTAVASVLSRIFRAILALVFATFAAPLPVILIFALDPELAFIQYLLGVALSALILGVAGVPIMIALTPMKRVPWWLAAVLGSVAALIASLMLEEVLASHTAWFQIISIVCGTVGGLTLWWVWKRTTELGKEGGGS